MSFEPLSRVWSKKNVPAYSTGSRFPVPDEQRTYWMAHAMDIIHTFSQHFQSLIPQCAVALGLQSFWARRSPPWFFQEKCCTPHVTSLLHVWGLRAVQFIPPQTFFRLRVHAVPDPSPSASQFNLVTSHNQGQRTFLFLRLQIVFQKFPWRPHHLPFSSPSPFVQVPCDGQAPPQQQAHL